MADNSQQEELKKKLMMDLENEYKEHHDLIEQQRLMAAQEYVCQKELGNKDKMVENYFDTEIAGDVKAIDKEMEKGGCGNDIEDKKEESKAIEIEYSNGLQFSFAENIANHMSNFEIQSPEKIAADQNEKKEEEEPIVSNFELKEERKVVEQEPVTKPAAKKKKGKKAPPAVSDGPSSNLRSRMRAFAA